MSHDLIAGDSVLMAFWQEPLRTIESEAHQQEEQTMRRCVLGCITALLMIVPGALPIAPALASEWVDFYTATVPPSEFKIKQAEEKGIELKPKLGKPIRYILLQEQQPAVRTILPPLSHQHKGTTPSLYLCEFEHS